MSKQQVIVESKAVGFGKSEKKVKGLNTALGGLATKAMGVAGAYFGARGVINALKSSLDLYAEQQLAEVKLESALGKTSIGLQRYASALQKTTRFGDELILQGMAQLAFFIKDEEQLKVATKATLDLASAKGMDLVQAADLVAKSVGSSTNALSRYGIAAEGAVGSEERLLSITDEIANLFGGQAEATTESYQGAIDQLSNAFGDMQEVIGQRLAPTVMSLAQSFTAMLSVPLSSELETERRTFDNMLETLKRLNPESETRKKLIEEIKNLYPSYLGDLDLEKASLQDINNLQRESQEFLMAQIAIARNEEEIAQAQSTRKQIAEELFDAQLSLTGAQKNYDEELESGGTTLTHLVGTALMPYGNTLEIAKATLDEAKEAVAALTEEFELNESKLDDLTSGTNTQVEAAKQLVEGNNKLKESKEEFLPLEIEFSEFQNAAKEKEIRNQEILNALNKKFITISRTKATMMQVNAGMEVASNSRIAGSFAALNQAAGGSAEMTRNLTIAQAFADAYAGSVRAFRDYPAPASFVVSASVIASGLAAAYNAENAYQQHMDSKQSQYGFEGVVDQPTQFTVGEGGASEFVSVTPMEGVDNSGAGTGVTVNIQGNVMTEEFVEGELADRIADAVRRGTDFGMS